MRKGKLAESVLIRSVLRELDGKEKLIAGPAVGQGFAAGKGEEGTEIFACASTAASDPELAVLALMRACNSASAAGAQPGTALMGLLLPETMEEKDLKCLIRSLRTAAEQIPVLLAGGHTEVTGAVTVPVISFFVSGYLRREAGGSVCGPQNIRPDQDLVMTKGIGFGATAWLAKTREEELKKRFSPHFIREAASFCKGYSVLPEATEALRLGVHAMHDVSEGGIFGALWEMAEGAGVGLDVNLKAIPVRQETIEICEFFGLNPYQLLSTGALLVSCEDGTALVYELEKKGIPSAVIGRTTDRKERVIRNGEDLRYLDKPQCDEINRILTV